MVRSFFPVFFERAVERLSLHPVQKKEAIIYARKKEAIIYARISQKNQKDGLSLESQVSNCIRYCTMNNYHLVEVIKEIGSAKDLSKLKKLERIIDEKDNINLIVSDTSRFCRNVKEGVNLLDLMDKKNIVLHCADKNFMSNVNDDYKQIVGGIKDAEVEIKTLSNRVKRTIKYKKDNNLYLPSLPKYGYSYFKIFDDNMIIKKIKEDPMEQKIILLVNEMYNGSPSKNVENLLVAITGNPNHKIYDYENNVEVKEIRRGNFTKKAIADFLNHLNIFRRGKKWTVNAISNILQQSN